MIGPTLVVGMVAGMTAVALIGWCWTWFRRRSLARRTVRRVEQQFAGAKVLAMAPSAFFCGMERSWDRQWQGFGVLLLTRDMMYFRSWQRNLDLMVALDRIVDVAASCEERFGLGLYGHLRIAYRGMDDSVRVATWRVERAHHWLELMGGRR